MNSNCISSKLQAGGGGIIGQVFLFGSIILIMYFFIVQTTARKKTERFPKNFIEGNQKRKMNVVTIGGMHGKVYQVDSDTVMLELDRGLKVKVEKSAISLEFLEEINPNEIN